MFKEDSKEKYLHEDNFQLFEQLNTTVDVAIFTIIEQQLHVLTVKRAQAPYSGVWSLVGGYVDIKLDKDLEATAKRKLAEKTGVKTPYLEQVETVGNSHRDPRGWSLTTVYFALVSNKNMNFVADKSAQEVKWTRVTEGKVNEKLAFDHDKLLSLCMERLQKKALYTSLPVHLMPRQFSLGELQKVYEVILNKKIDAKSFRRRLLSVELLEDTGEVKSEGKRPAKLYRLKESQKTYFFMRI